MWRSARRLPIAVRGAGSSLRRCRGRPSNGARPASSRARRRISFIAKHLHASRSPTVPVAAAQPEGMEEFMSIRSIALALAAAATFAVPAAARAAEAAVSTAGVNYKDLDLTSEAGQKELDRRVDRAARQVCGMDEAVVGSRVVPRESR